MRLDSSFSTFNKFIDDMGMEEVNSNGSIFTWANNRGGEGFVEERLDRFFEAANWFI